MGNNDDQLSRALREAKEPSELEKKFMRRDALIEGEQMKDLPCSAHAKEQEVREFTEDEMKAMGEALNGPVMEKYDELKEIKNVETGTTEDEDPDVFKLMPPDSFTIKPMDTYVIDTEKIKTVEDVVDLIVAMNVVFTSPTDALLPFLIKTGENENDRKD